MKESLSLKKNDLWVNLVLLVVSTGVAVESYRMGLGDFHSPGAGFMIFGASTLLGLLSFHLLLKTVLGRDSSKKNPWRGKNWRRVASVFLLLALYIIFLGFLGYLVTTFLFLFLLFKILGHRGWTVPLASGVAVALITYLVFSQWLALNFPAGLVSF